MAFQTVNVDVFKGRQTTPDRYIIPAQYHFSGINSVVGLDGNINKASAPVKLHSGAGATASINSSYNFRQGSAGGHWWLYDAADTTFAIDKITGQEYALRTGQSTATWMSVGFNNVCYRTNSVASEMILYTSGASGTTAKIWGLTAPTPTITITTSGVGSLAAISGYGISYAYVDSTTGHVGPLAPIVSLGAFSGKTTIAISNLPNSGPARADKIYFFGSLDGGYISGQGGNLYRLDDANGVPLSKAVDATTTFNITYYSPNVLVLAPFYNQAPPSAKYCLRYQDRVLFWGLSSKNTIQYTSVENIFIGTREECVPAGFNTLTMPDEVTALGICPVGLLIFSVSRTWLLSGQMRDTIPSSSFTQGAAGANISIPNISQQLEELPFIMGTVSPYTVVTDNRGVCWWYDTTNKVRSFDGRSEPVEQSMFIRDDMELLDLSQRTNFRATFYGAGNRQGYLLLCQSN